MNTAKGFKYAGFGVLGIAGMILFTFVVMWLWNWLVPELFKGPVLGYWQALGLLVLSKILFSGFSGGSKSSHRRKYNCDEDYYSGMPKSRWRQKYEARMNKNESEGKADGDAVITENE